MRVLASACSGGEGEFGTSGRAITSPVISPGGKDQHGRFIERPSPRVVLAVGVALLAAVLGAGTAQLAEGNRVAAGFGEEVAAVTEHVCQLA